MRVEIAGQRARQRRRASGGGAARCIGGPRRRASLGRAGPRRTTIRSRSEQRTPFDVLRALPGQQLVEQQPELIHVGRGRDRLAAHLLGAGVFGRQDAAPARSGSRRRRRPPARAASRCRSRAASRRRRPSTRMFDGLRSRWTTSRRCACCTAAQTLLEQRRAARSIVSRVLVTVLDRSAALDVLHHEVRASVLGATAIEQPRDAGVVERGQRSAARARTAA